MFIVLSLWAANALGLSVVAQTHRTYGDWMLSDIGGGGGGYLQRVTICPSDPKRYYVYVDVGGIYRSDDAGRTWRILHGTHKMPGRGANFDVRGLTVDPRNADIVVAALKPAPSSLYRTEDGGETWTPVGMPSIYANAQYRDAGDIFARNPKNPDMILLATQGSGVLRSTDNGKTWGSSWAAHLPTIYATDIIFDHSNPSRVWLCAQTITGNTAFAGGMFLSEDSGATWSQIGEAGPFEIVQDRINSKQIYGIFGQARVGVSIDGGKTWNDFSEGLPGDAAPKTGRNYYTSGIKYTGLAAGPDFVLVNSAAADIYIRKNDAHAWTKVERTQINQKGWFREGSGSFGWACAWIAVDPYDANHWLFTDWYALYQSYDAGKSWTLSVEGIEPTVIHDIIQDQANPSTVHMGMADNGYFRSQDGGVRFDKTTPGLPSSNIKRIIPAPSQSGRLYASGNAGGGHKADRIFVSDDGGDSWRTSPMKGLPDMNTHACNSINVHPKRENELYAALSGTIANGGGVYRSINGAMDWERFGSGLPDGVALFPDSIWTSGGNEIAISQNGGLVVTSHILKKTWFYDVVSNEWALSDLPQGDRIASILALPGQDGQFYASLRGGGLYRSFNGGKNWALIYDVPIFLIQIDTANPGRIAIATDKTVLVSLDEGKTWLDLDAGRNLPISPVRTMTFAGTRLLVGTGGTGIFWHEAISAAPPVLK